MAKAANIDALRKAAADAYEAYAQAAAKLDEAEAGDASVAEAEPATAAE
jgi:hypothetical protein